MELYIDGGVDVPLRLKKKFKVIPVHITDAHGNVYRSTEVSAELVSKLEKPRTSAPSPGEFLKFFKEEGICLTISSKVSAIFNSARLAAKLSKKVTVFDTGSLSVGSGVLAKIAYELRREGPAETIAELSRARNRVIVLAPLTASLVEGLRKSGRLSLHRMLWESAKILGPLLKVYAVIRSDWRVGITLDPEIFLEQAEYVLVGHSKKERAKELAKEYGGEPAVISPAYSAFAGSNIFALGLLLEKPI